MGIDYGTKRVGIALSDEGGTMAFPYGILENTKHLLGEVKAICSKEHVEVVVVGESLNYEGKPNSVMEHIDQFATSLRAETGLPIAHQQEFLSTQQARFFQTEKVHVDDSAATIILQSYLDRINQKPILETL